MPKPVYESILTRTSAQRLAGLVQGIPHPVALAGGHAVWYTVQDQWRKHFGQDYFGSRDIDVLYHVDPSWSRSQLLASPAAQAPKRIEALGYKPISFRYMQLLDENGAILQQEPSLGIEDVTVFRLYIDPMVTNIHKDLHELWSFQPIDEPLLTQVFHDPAARRTLAELGQKVFLPAAPYLIATKLNSLPSRTKDDKAIKDLCDLYALLAYGGTPLAETRRIVHGLLPDTANRVQATLTNANLPTALEHLDLERNDYQAVIGPLALRP